MLLAVFLACAVLDAPLGLSMLVAGYAYLAATGQDAGLVIDQAMNGLYNNYLLLAVPLFILVANTMTASGVLDRILRFAQTAVGRFRGGLAHANIVSNLLFSGMSGSAVADAAGPGLLVARMMMREGRYPEGFPAALSAAAATLGPLVPPSIPMILYSLLANVSVGALFLAGLLPAAMAAFALSAAVAILARRHGFSREPAASKPEVMRAFRRAAPALALPVLLLGIIYSGAATPTEAAAIAAAYALLLALCYRSLSLRALSHVLRETVRTTAAIGLMFAGAFVFNYAVANENIAPRFSASLSGWHLAPTGFLLAVDVALLLLAVIV
ncbi:MAG: TRAP transporter large permease subunit, partial [Acetobacteraceae bacterium]|nr:TRAP transporter large permease subunit [Acetobacteraceae bacterium]